MDDKARQRAIYRAKLNAQKKEKRIDSPLVRYNEHDQPVCRVCNVVMKSESYWDAHQASRKHHEAVNNLKAAATTSLGNNAKPVPQPGLPEPRPKPEHVVELHKPGLEPREFFVPQSASGLPPDFFDKNNSKRLNSNKDSAPSVEHGLHKETIECNTLQKSIRHEGNMDVCNAKEISHDDMQCSEMNQCKDYGAVTEQRNGYGAVTTIKRTN